MRHLARAALAIALATATGLAGYAVTDAQHADASTVLGPGLVTVTVSIRYSRFSMSTLKVRPGSTVRFLVRNDDPITHEFIVGDAAVHARHEHGTHPAHPPVPGEVTVSAARLGETFFRFDQPGRYLFACHLPGHFAYGMRGWIEVEPA
ncbi:MAG: hypothetical protein QOG50_3783 [Actinomycetota bacterium]|nr:hypothetical protein [Actinomycetota bacterium]